MADLFILQMCALHSIFQTSIKIYAEMNSYFENAENKVLFLFFASFNAILQKQNNFM